MAAAAAAAVQPSDESRKNDRVFSALRKRKNFEIFSTRSDGGDIEAGDVGCREAGRARPPWVKRNTKLQPPSYSIHAFFANCKKTTKSKNQRDFRLIYYLWMLRRA